MVAMLINFNINNVKEILVLASCVYRLSFKNQPTGYKIDM
jgi:hypothetical protein